MNKINDNAAALDSDLLRTFLIVAQEANISRGATRVGRTQSAVTLQLQRLEEIVGQVLFHRHARGVTLSPAGENLLPTAREVVATLDRVVQELRGKPSEGTIRIGIPDEYGDKFLVEILGRFADLHPGAQVEVRCSSSVMFPSELAAGRLDIAVHSPELAAARSRGPRSSQPGDRLVHREHAVWVGSAYAEIADRRPLPVALFDKACWWRDRTIEMLRLSGLDFHIVCSSESLAGVRAAIVSGIAVGVLPRCAVTSELRLLDRPALPSIGQSPVILSLAPQAPKDLATTMSRIIVEAFRGRPVDGF